MLRLSLEWTIPPIEGSESLRALSLVSCLFSNVAQPKLRQSLKAVDPFNGSAILNSLSYQLAMGWNHASSVQ